MTDDIESTHPETAERLERLSVETLDRILGVPFKVLDDGFVRVIDSVFRLDEIRRAHERLADRAVFGKVVVVP